MSRFLCAAALVALLAPGAARAERAGALGPDKALHLGVSCAVAALGYGLGAELFDRAGPRVALGAGLALSAGIGKELWDLGGHGSAEWLDLAFDLLGVGLGLLVAYAIDSTIAHHRRAHRTHAALAP